jgi:hypothetical protein
VHPKAPAPIAKASRPSANPATTDRAPVSANDIAALFRAGRLDDVIAACEANARFAASAAQCAIAACRRRDESKAHRWYAATATAKRPIVKQACEAAGIALEPKRPDRPSEPTPEPKRDPPSKPKCDPSDPMSCRE